MPDPTLSHLLLEHLKATGAYWWFVFVGVLIPLPDIWKHLHPRGTELPLPRWLRWTACLLCIPLAQFLAYKNQTINLVRVIEEKRQFSIQVNTLTAELQEEKLKNASIPKPFKEPPDSLRRRTFRLAKEVYDFAVERAAHCPPFAGPNSNDPNPTEERKREIKLYQDYARETENQYKERYRDRLVGIVKEYEAKGVRVHWLANDFQQRPPAIAFLGSGMEGSPMDELYQFRELAYHVDAQDHLITIY
jgi:hypothetical protein